MNGREMRRLGASRRQLFEAIERPAMLIHVHLGPMPVAELPRRPRWSPISLSVREAA